MIYKTEATLTEETDTFSYFDTQHAANGTVVPVCLTVAGLKPSAICVLDKIQDLICMYSSTFSEMLMLLAVNLHCC